METALLLAQFSATGSIAGWLSLGVRDNILHPSVNETYTAEVMDMTRMRTEFPAQFAEVAHRAVSDRRTQLLAFRLIVVIELATVVLLWVGATALAMALFGFALPETARALAILGATAFTTIWAGFLIVGNHFSYWFCHEGAQNTHYQMTLWGLGTLILLAQTA
ncbi:DUF2165 domain-containing protein [Roseobacter denitrificans]|uniref:Uncharacterized protein n=1 Tax=Roseobacter denitrificans (strain ATCC 33942 / OCh 114) TaxID=375451 RepID=Q16AQ8_ROSDO|nr:DUF2165 domain-containing protein [Roseobacter denitrificans]ABG30935.1 hypothetical protein RD1_1290 [Roseobacter denitrificans OCh 114]AVL54026.1 DUF2165 domain-containing protein [Roseobacter denitrificans]SFG13895.1 Predicted small integral membrane protein [Roseobacter denitrificans OCh 114]